MKPQFFNPPPKFETERLQIRPIVPQDAQALFELRSIDAINEYLDRKKPESVEKIAEFIQQLLEGFQKNEWMFWVISLRDNPRIIGTICFWNFEEDLTEAELGYELLPEMQGHGYMHEASMAILQFGFEQMHLHRIVAQLNIANKSSVRMLEKLDFKPHRVMAPVLTRDGKITTYAIYTRTKP